jgi:hypothetical protein
MKSRLYYLALAVLGVELFLVCGTGAIPLGLSIFFWGQAGAILIEWLYLSLVLKWARPLLVLGLVFLMNCVTTLIGFILCFLLLALEKVHLSPSILESMLRDSTDGFYRLSKPIYLISLSMFFFFMYLVSAYVQGSLLIEYNGKNKFREGKSIMKHSFIFNGLIYAGFLLFAFTIVRDSRVLID